MSGYVEDLLNSRCQECLLGASCSVGCKPVIPESTCKDGITQCNLLYKEESPTHCRPMFLTIEPCQYNSDCVFLHSECSHDIKKCVCKITRFPTQNLRLCSSKYVGYPCSDSDECREIKPDGFCSKDVCVCIHGYTALTGSRSCTARELGDLCSHSIDCSQIPGGTCVDGKCACNVGYFTIEGEDGKQYCRGRKLWYEICMTNAECYNSVANSICIQGFCEDPSACPRVCDCKPGYRARSSLASCAPSTIKSDCSTDSHCLDGVDNSFCDGTRCRCLPGYHEESPRNCTKLFIGATCNEGEDCFASVPKSECSGRQCKCMLGWYKQVR